MRARAVAGCVPPCCSWCRTRKRTAGCGRLANGRRIRRRRGRAPSAAGLPDRARPGEPRTTGRSENEPGQAPGQEAQPDSRGRRSFSSGLRLEASGPTTDLAARAEPVVHDVAVVIDGDVAGVELVNLVGGQAAVERDAFDDAQLIGKFLVEFLGSFWPAARG